MLSFQPLFGHCILFYQKKISEYGYNTIQSTRRIFLYGIVFMIPLLFVFDFKLDISRFSENGKFDEYVVFGCWCLCIVLCYLEFYRKKLGTVKTSVYIYLVPVITVIASVLILKEKIMLFSLCGIFLTILGLMLSQIKKRSKTYECSK